MTSDGGEIVGSGSWRNRSSRKLVSRLDLGKMPARRVNSVLKEEGREHGR